MSLTTRRAFARVALTCLAVVPGAFVLAQGGKDDPQMELPPGWTMADMEACMMAATPGEMHEKLMQTVGVWEGQNRMWMAPEMEAMVTDTTWTMKSLYDGRFVECEVEGDMPGMGPFHGRGVAGYDNVAQEFVADWIDSMSTGIMRGTGTLSDDGTTFTWEYEYHCPIQKKLVPFRQVQRLTGPNAMSVEMYAADPKSGKEYKCMEVELKKRS